MIVDSSAVVAIIMDESDADALSDCLLAASGARMAAPTYVEVSIVCDQRPTLVAADLDEVLEAHAVSVAAFTPEQAQVARTAYQRYGRGSGHPASLNFGDCFSYAMAIVANEPLLFTGDDFTHTDVRNALAEAEAQSEPTA